MKPERVVVRSLLTLIVVGASVAFLPVALVLKLAEGVAVVARITVSSISQVWRARGIAELD